MNINLNAPTSTPELPRDILSNIVSLAEEEELPRLALVSRLFYTFVLELERQGAKKSLQNRLASIQTDILPNVIKNWEIAILDEVKQKLNALQEKLGSAFTGAHISKRRDAVHIRHVLQHEICQTVTMASPIGEAFVNNLSRQINAIGPNEETTTPGYDIPHTIANRRMMQLFLYARACNHLNGAKEEYHFKSKALTDLARSHRPDEALALFKHMVQSNQAAWFPHTYYNKHAVILLVKILNQAKRSSDVKYINDNLNNTARAQVAFTGDTMLCADLIWKSADDTPDPYLTQLVGEL